MNILQDVEHWNKRQLAQLVFASSMEKYHPQFTKEILTCKNIRNFGLQGFFDGGKRPYFRMTTMKDINSNN
jgi:hypothetical protein